MALLSSSVAGEAGLRLLLSPVASNVVLRTACCTVGTVFPVYATFKAIETKNKKDQEQCLLYWAVYGSLSIVEVFSDRILSWFPMYYHAKLAFLIWLQLPSSFGSRQLYVKYLRPFLLRHRARLDQITDGTFNEINKFVEAHAQEIQFLRTALRKAIVKVCQLARECVAPPSETRRDVAAPAERPSDGAETGSGWTMVSEEGHDSDNDSS